MPAAPAMHPHPPLPDPALDAGLLQPVVDAVRLAAAAVMQVDARPIAVQHKADAWPVTEADAQAEALIVPALHALLPGVPVVAEEAVAADGLPALGDTFWLVDPLDGTREFIARNGEFTVNVALVRQGVPVLGVVAAPAQGDAASGGRLYAGVPGQGAWVQEAGMRHAIACRPLPQAGITLLTSRSHGDGAPLQTLLAQRLAQAGQRLAQAGQRLAQQRVMGSSLKLCVLAAGDDEHGADLYARLGRTMAWDIAAGHAVLAAASGEVWRLDGSPLRHGGPAGVTLENPGLIATTDHTRALARATGGAPA